MVRSNPRHDPDGRVNPKMLKYGTHHNSFWIADRKVLAVIGLTADNKVVAMVYEVE